MSIASTRHVIVVFLCSHPNYPNGWFTRCQLLACYLRYYSHARGTLERDVPAVVLTSPITGLNVFTPRKQWYASTKKRRESANVSIKQIFMFHRHHQGFVNHCQDGIYTVQVAASQLLVTSTGTYTSKV